MSTQALPNRRIADAGIVTGYPCGGTNEPCVPPGNLPYYRPTNDVTRQQMGKFVDLARNTPGITMDAGTMLSPWLIFSQASGGANIRSYTNADNQNAIYALSNASNSTIIEATDQAASAATTGVEGRMYGVNNTGVAGYTSGSTSVGVWANATGANSIGMQALASGTSSYATTATSSSYRAAYAESDDNTTGWASLYVDPGHNGQAAVLNGDTDVNGVLTVNSCVGCFGPTEVMQNLGDSPIEAGDVVQIVGTGPAVVGAAPALQVRKTGSAYDAAVVGVAGQALYVPNAETRAAYEQEQAAMREAMIHRQAIMSGPGSNAEKTAELASIAMPSPTIDDNMGTVHFDGSASGVVANSYGTLATQGTVPAVKVTAANGSIHAGDLLVSSDTPGVAMKADLSKIVPGTVIGKALGDLQSGTGTVPVLITLK